MVSQEEINEWFEERAAIREYMGKIPRDEAEMLAIWDIMLAIFGEL